MRMKNPTLRACAISIAALACPMGAMAAEGNGSEVQNGAGTNLGATSTLYTAFEASQFVKYKYRQEDFRYAWRNRAYFDYSSHYSHSESFDVDMGLGAFLWYNSFPKQRNEDVHNLDSKHVSLFISQAQGTYRFGDPEKPIAELALGIFPYKYNGDVRNLGEYLYRSGAYPNFLLGDFDFALTRLTGARLSAEPLRGWRNDILMTTETDIWPHFDWTLGWVTAWKTGGGLLELGGGVAFTNLISANKDQTDPRSLKNMYIENLHSDSALLPGTDIKIEVVTGDTGYYSFRSTKLMGRAALNPQALFRAPWLGPEDLKLYAEVAVLGWKNYPRPTPSDTLQINSFYTDRMQRMPVMFGCNLPAFGILDLLSLEVEWYGLQGPDSYQRRKEDEVPVPQPVDEWIAKNGSYKDADYREDNWKWSLYAKKDLVPGCAIVAQAARDHVRHNFDSPVQLDREEALTRPGQWWWAAKIEFHQ